MSFFRKKYKIFITILVVLVLVIIYFIRYTYRNVYCKDIQITFEQTGAKNFIDTNELISYLSKSMNFKIIGNKFKSINLFEVEQQLEKIPYISNVDVYRDKNNLLCINIYQYNPIAQIFDNKGYSYYLSEEGQFLPIKTSVSFYVPIFNGNIPNNKRIFEEKINVKDTIFYNKIERMIYEFAYNLYTNEYAGNLIDQVYIDKEQELTLIPKIGNFVIFFGDTTNFEAKIEKLKAFYTTGLPRVGWDRYSIINLKFDNQIVCVKN